MRQLRRPRMKELLNTGKFDLMAVEAVADLQQETVVAEVDDFDNLSKTLADQAEKLSDDDAEVEKTLRPQVMEALRNYSTDQSTVGRLLSEYKRVYKTQRQWTSVATKIGKTIDCSARTIYRMVEKHEAAPTTVTSSLEDADRREIDGLVLSRQERRKRDARLAIRVFLNNIPNDKKREVLADLLAEEAYQVWGITEPFSVEVKPRVSAFTIDGRKKLPVHQAEEKAA